MDSNARPSGANLPNSLRWGHMGILAFWLVVMGLLYAGLSVYMKPKEATITAEGDLVIPRHRDGHFYVEGKLHGKPILFMVDTGATSVVVSEAFARAAGLPQGEPTTFMTANGTLRGATVHAAHALGLHDRGRLQPGQRADFVQWTVQHPAELCYWLGGETVHSVHIAGRRVSD